VAAAEAYGGVTDPEFVDAIARAIVAFVLAAHRADPLGTAPLATRKRDARDALVDAVREAFQPAAPRGVVGWLAGKVKEFAESRATSYIRDRRFKKEARNSIARLPRRYRQRAGPGLARNLVAARGIDPKTVCPTFPAILFREGPRVRIRLPPAKGLLRTCGYVDPCRREGLFAVIERGDLGCNRSLIPSYTARAIFEWALARR
jgi:hypothetical protein